MKDREMGTTQYNNGVPSTRLQLVLLPKPQNPNYSNLNSNYKKIVKIQ